MKWVAITIACIVQIVINIKKSNKKILHKTESKMDLCRKPQTIYSGNH